MMKNKKVMIIGGTGSWGLALLEQLLKAEAAQIKVLARNEHNLVALQQQFRDKRVQPILGDIRNRTHLMQACKDVDIIFHLAALKHVPICEQMPREAILTNVIGTQNVIDCATSCKVKKVIYVSTDKAISPNCTYGCTKLLGEKLILSANAHASHTKFTVFRCGNLLGSSGSVIPLFKRQIEQTQRVNLTDKRMNRFFIPIAQAAQRLIEVAERGQGGEVFLPPMDALAIHDIAKYLLSKNGLNETQINITGIRKGETISETMVTTEESKSLYQVSETLYAFIEEANQTRMGQSFVKVENYQAYSADAVLPYKQARAFLNEANI